MTTITDVFYLGDASNMNTADPFNIKDYGIFTGGAIQNYVTAGYAFTTLLPKCLLKMFKNNVNNAESTGVCVLCEWYILYFQICFRIFSSTYLYPYIFSYIYLFLEINFILCHFFCLLSKKIIINTKILPYQ